MLAPCSLACPVKLWTLCSRLSLDFAGLEGALMVLALGFRFNDISLLLEDGGGAPVVPACPPADAPCSEVGAPGAGPAEGTPGLMGG